MGAGGTESATELGSRAERPISGDFWGVHGIGRIPEGAKRNFVVPHHQHEAHTGLERARMHDDD